MAKKMYKKSDLSYVNGYIVTKDDEIVLLPNDASNQLMHLEYELQKLEWLKNKPKLPLIEYPDFVRKSEFETAVPEIAVETPLLDEQVQRSMKMREEIDNQKASKMANKFLAKYEKLFRFIGSDLFTEGDSDIQFDLPTLGNPLELTADKVVQLVTAML